MRKITLIISMMAISAIAFSQNCLQVIQSGTAFSNPSGDGKTFTLTIKYTTDGQKTLAVIVKCGATVILTDCFINNGDGTKIYTGLFCDGGIDAISAEFTPRTGNCTSAACGPVYILPPGGGDLPVKLSLFLAKRNSNAVALNWRTETEINSKEFILERRTGSSFVAVATIPAANRANGSSYSYTDNNQSKGVSQYRLKIVDLDGSFTYSSVSAVKGTASVSDFTVFPNPSNGSAKVTISDISESTEIQLVDLSGRVLKNVIISNSNTVELNSLKKGMYMIRIVNKNSGESTTQKLSVVN